MELKLEVGYIFETRFGFGVILPEDNALYFTSRGESKWSLHKSYVTPDEILHRNPEKIPPEISLAANTVRTLLLE